MARATGRGKSAAVIEWRKSDRWKRIASAQAQANLRAWAALPRCNATAKTTGCRCKQPARPNGKCRWHGGSTPSGKNWHQPVFSAGTTPSGTSKLDRKLFDLAQARKKRAKVLAAMTSEQRAAYKKWYEARDPRLSVRLSRRQRKEQALTARALFELEDRPATPEIMLIEEKIRLLKIEVEALTRSPSLETAAPDQAKNDLGIFG